MKHILTTTNKIKLLKEIQPSFVANAVKKYIIEVRIHHNIRGKHQNANETYTEYILYEN